ncbi:MAG: DNA gyrase inhibitor YacG [Elusimicrobiota bacterium]|nr:DNA gyrase inhibitor YacG [Elusimicrobiota bacterium]
MSGENVIPLPREVRPCPQCGKPAAPAYRPFCSKRCADIDLGKWLDGAYAIPAEAAPDEALEAEAED